MNEIITIAVGTLGWIIAKKIKLPAPGMLGSMIMVGMTNVMFSYASFYMPVRVIGVSISGAYIGMKIKRKDMNNFKYMIRPFLLLIIMLTINTFVVGSIFHYMFDIDWLTAFLSCVAGGAADMSIVAMDLGAEAGTVALMQTLRLIGTLLVFPTWISCMTRNEPESKQDERMLDNLDKETGKLNKLINTQNKKIIFTFLIAVISGFFGKWTKIPAASLVVPMLIVMIINVPTNVCLVTSKQKLCAQIIAGSVVGCSIKAATFTSIKTTLFPIVILLFSYFVVNYIYSLVCKKLNYLDMKSAMFASAPGGATDMTLIATDLGADLTKIALIQSFRAIYVIAIMPLLIVGVINLLSLQ